MKNNPVLNLQDVVDSYNEPAVLISDSYEIICANSAYKNLYRVPVHDDPAESKNYCEGDGLLSDQCYCYEVSHHYSRSCDQEGESCPLQLAKTTQNNQRVLHIHQTRFGEEHVDVSLFPIHDENGQLFFLEVMKTIKHASPQVGHKGMVGKSQAFNRLLSLVNRVSQHDISVLLQGESGSGKELVAHAIHQASARHSSACVTVECSGLSESLFESELFGHEKGAFTGAINKKKGLVEEAEGGTLFLDEIGDVPLSLQVKLLRLIETRTFRKVGGVEQLTANFRLVCATHKNLKTMVKNGEFREDLYYRISTFPIQLPTLSERKADIPLLVNTMLERLTGNPNMHVSNEVMQFFLEYQFPGNIRQLRNVLEYGRVMADTDLIEMIHLPEELQEINRLDKTENIEKNIGISDKKAQFPFESIKTLEQLEQDYLSWLSVHFNGDNKTLAEKLGVSERTLYRKMQIKE